MSDAIDTACVPSPDGHCSICGDEATAWRVTAIDVDASMAEVTRDGTVSTVAMDLLEDIALGDVVLVHMGFAISRVREGDLA